MKMDRLFFLLPALLFATTIAAQQPPTDSTKTTGHKLVFSGMLITRFSQSFTKTVDVNGNAHPQTETVTTSSLLLRRARVQAKAQVSARAEASVLLNLSDFTGNPSGKVLENAYIKYRFNGKANLQVGQFRPFFGKEDLVPEELLPALEWTNLYYRFGANGWQSFQIGATFFGSARLLHLPLSYAIGVFNGNGRNQPADNNNGKLVPARIELALLPKTKLGLNAGWGKDGREAVWAYAADIDHTETIGRHWELNIQSEYKRGTNQAQFDTASDQNKSLSRYRVQGYYVLPHLLYKCKGTAVKALELTLRYESCTAAAGGCETLKETWMPVLCLHLADASALCLKTGLIIDRYHNPETPAGVPSATRLVCQLQARF